MSDSKELKIKCDVLFRTKKDLEMYKKEEIEQIKRIEELKNSNADSFVLRKQREVLDETLEMIENTKARIETARKELKNILNSFPNDVSFERATNLLKN